MAVYGATCRDLRIQPTDQMHPLRNPRRTLSG
jgi:hypothetical protein